MLDDFDNLSALEVNVTDRQSLIAYLETGKAGPLGRPISKLSFLLDDNAWPSHPENFKRTNLLIHLLVGILIFAALRIILKIYFEKHTSDLLALFVTALWLTHPFQVSTVSYVVQRMTQLSSLFIVTGVITHLYIRTRFQKPQPEHVALLTASLIGFTLLASFSKENGVLLAVYLLTLEATVLSRLPSTNIFLWWKRIFLILPTSILILYLAYLPNWTGSYATRDFSLTERLITQPVILVDYVTSFFNLRVHGLGLFQDDYPIYNSLTNPIAWTSLLLIITALIAAIKYRARFPLIAFGILWFLSGHILESTTVSLELYFEHRNYLPILGPLLAFSIACHRGIALISDELRKLSPLFGIAIIAITSMTTYGYATEWGTPLRLIPIWSAEHPNSPRAQRTFAQTLASAGETSGALDVLDDAYKRFPHDLSIPIISIDISCRFGRPLRYQISDLADNIKSHKWTDGLRPALQSLFKGIKDTHCDENIANLHKLVHSLFDLKDGELRHRAIAAIYILSADLYLEERNPSRALTNYHIIDNIHPTASSAQRIAGFYLLARQFDDARKWLKIAQSRETTRSFFDPGSENALYLEKFELIDRHENNTRAIPQ